MKVTTVASRRLMSYHVRTLTKTTTTTTSAAVNMNTSNVGMLRYQPNVNNITARRTYRGASGEESQKDLSAEEEALLKIAQPRAEMIFQRHIKLPSDDSDNNNNNTVDGDDINGSNLTTRQKRLIYRSKQRGWLEVDLLLGTWASQNVADLSDKELDQFEDFVNQETIDIYNIITLRVPVPDQLKNSNPLVDGPSVVEQIQSWAKSHPLGKADPESYKSVKTEHKLI
jgi:succinate dehydrogenase assembly factor 2